MNVGPSNDILAGERASTWKGSVHNNNNVYTFATSWYIARVNDPLQYKWLRPFNEEELTLMLGNNHVSPYNCFIPQLG